MIKKKLGGNVSTKYPPQSLSWVDGDYWVLNQYWYYAQEDDHVVIYAVMTFQTKDDTDVSTDDEIDLIQRAMDYRRVRIVGDSDTE